MQPTGSRTKAFLRNLRRSSGTPRDRDSKSERCLCTHIFQAACGRHGTSNERVGPDKSAHPFLFSKHQKFKIHGYETVAINVKEGDHTKTLPPSCFGPVSFRFETIKGQSPTKLAPTSTSSCITRLLLMMAFFLAGRKAIQSQLSACFNLLTLNSVMENGSGVPKTLDAVR